MIYKKIFVLFTLIFFVHSISFSQESAETIFKRATKQLLVTDMELSIEVKITDKSGRLKEKTFNVLRASYGDINKTKMTMLKPERAKGITIVFTEYPKELGEIDILTPANGKVRKMKATPENMAMIGSDFSMSTYATQNPEELKFSLLGEEVMNGKKCFKIEVKEKKPTENGKAEILVEQDSYYIMQVEVFDEKSESVSITKFSKFQSLSGNIGKIQAMQMNTEDFKTMKNSEMHILKIEPRKSISEDEFKL